jgi:prepilin-type N-terminal cleavage/methylation domain-containing protein
MSRIDSIKIKKGGKVSTQGFTLPEILLSLTLMSIIAGMSLPLYRTFNNRNDLDQTIALYAQSLRRAQALSIAQIGDSVWGVKVLSSSILLFKGPSYNSRDQVFDESISFSPTITFSGVSEVTFLKRTGVPSGVGTTTFILYQETRDAFINQKGVIEY